MLITNFCVFPSLRKDVSLSTFPTASFLATLESGNCLRAELRSPVTSCLGLEVAPCHSGHAIKPRQKKRSSGVRSLKNSLSEWGLQHDQEHGKQEQKLGLKYTHTNQNYSGHEIMQTNLARNELQNTFIFSYRETLIKSQLLRSYSISGGITVFRTPLLMHTTSQSKRIRAQFPDANDLILSYLAVYI